MLGPPNSGLGSFTEVGVLFHRTFEAARGHLAIACIMIPYAIIYRHRYATSTTIVFADIGDSDTIDKRVRPYLILTNFFDMYARVNWTKAISQSLGNSMVLPVCHR